nr:hypothetical protein DWF04_16605 [Cereibacter sphaeroides f. sp. denitrificans]
MAVMRPVQVAPFEIDMIKISACSSVMGLKSDKVRRRVAFEPEHEFEWSLVLLHDALQSNDWEMAPAP